MVEQIGFVKAFVICFTNAEAVSNKQQAMAFKFSDFNAFNNNPLTTQVSMSDIKTELDWSGVVTVTKVKNHVASKTNDDKVVGDSPRLISGHPRNTSVAFINSDGSFVVMDREDATDYGKPYSAETLVDLVPGADNLWAAVTDGGKVITFGGGSFYDAIIPRPAGLETELSSGVTKVVAGHTAFAALKDDGSVVSWAENDAYIADSTEQAQLASGVLDLHAARMSFMAVKSTTCVFFGSQPPVLTPSQISELYNIDLVVTTPSQAATVYLVKRSDGRLFSLHGITSKQMFISPSEFSSMTSLMALSKGASAYSSDKNLYVWYPGSHDESIKLVDGISGTVTDIRATNQLFCALTDTGNAYAYDADGVKQFTMTRIGLIRSNLYNFAFVNNEGTLVEASVQAEGRYSDMGGIIPTSPPSNVVQVVGWPNAAFIAIDGNDTITGWGKYVRKAYYDWEEDVIIDAGGDSAPSLTNVAQVVAFKYGFAATLNDGTVRIWSGFSNVSYP